MSRLLREPELQKITVSHSIALSGCKSIIHESQVCKNCLSEMTPVPGADPLDQQSVSYKCQNCGTEERVYN